MADIFSEAASADGWLRAEAALSLSQAEVGDLPGDVAETIAAVCTLDHIDLERLWEETANVGYPILPLLHQLTAQLPPSAEGSMHFGATTQDIMDTGLALQLSAAHDRLDELTMQLGDALAERTAEFSDTVMAGRTHGQQAVPTTLGAKLATFLRQVTRLRADLADTRRVACRISLYGAAGTSAGLGPRAAEVRAAMARRLELEPGAGSWHVERDGLAAFGAACARAAAICARLAREVVDLSRTEIGEVRESTGHHRGASSTMPQKANPIDSETVIGMAGSVTATAGSLYRAMEGGHERSAGEWQIEWHVLPQVAVMTAGALLVSGRIVREMSVDAERMAANLELEQGRTLAEAYMFVLAESLGRERAHDVMYEAATRSKAERIDLHTALVEVAGVSSAEVPVLTPADYIGAAPEEASAAVAAWRSVSDSPR